MNKQDARTNLTAPRPCNSQANPWWQWWPLLIGPAAMLLTYVAYWCNWTWFLSKESHEIAALALLTGATAAYLAAALRGRNPAHVILTVLAAVFLCRELHFVGTNNGTYIALVLLAVWSWRWRARLVTATAVGLFRPWLFASGWAYFLSQLVARRVFRGMPLEEQLQNPGWLEETVETGAHLALLITAFADLFGRRISRHTKDQSQSDQPDPS